MSGEAHESLGGVLGGRRHARTVWKRQWKQSGMCGFGIGLAPPEQSGPTSALLVRDLLPFGRRAYLCFKRSVRLLERPRFLERTATYYSLFYSNNSERNIVHSLYVQYDTAINNTHIRNFYNSTS